MLCGSSPRYPLPTLYPRDERLRYVGGKTTAANSASCLVFTDKFYFSSLIDFKSSDTQGLKQEKFR